MKRESDAKKIGEIFDVEPETVRRWARDGCPHNPAKVKGKGARFAEPEVAAWLKSKGLSGKVGRPGEPALLAARIRKENALASRYEHELGVVKGQYVEVEIVQRDMVAKVYSVKSKMMDIPSRAHLIAMKEVHECEQVLTEWMREICEHFANGGT